MGNDESRREENYQEYLRLKQNPDYYDVTFDVQSGGVSAIHKDHCFDKTMGPFGIRRGKYETRTMDCCRGRARGTTCSAQMGTGRGGQMGTARSAQ
jgi:hypothetical protein